MSGTSSSGAAAQPPRPQLRVWILLAVTLALALAVGLALAWLARRDLAARYAVQALKGQGVDAQVRLDTVDPHRIAGSLTLGPPGAPTVTVPHFEARIGLGVDGRATVRAVTLQHPTFIATVDRAGRVSFGQLDALIRRLQLKPAAPGAPSPDIDVVDGRLWLTTPGGAVKLAGAGQVRGGQLVSLDATAGPATLRFGPGVVQVSVATARLRAMGPVTVADARVALANVSGIGSARLRSADLAAHVEGHIDLAHLRVDAVSVHAALTANDVAAAGLEATAITSAADLAGLAAQWRGDGGSLMSGAGSLTLAADRASIGATDLRGVSSKAAITRLSLAGRGRAWQFGLASAGSAQAVSAHAPVLGAPATLSDVALRWQVQTSSSAPTRATLAVSARGALSEAAVRRLADTSPIGAPDGDGASLAPALRNAVLSAPVVSLSGANGAWQVGLGAQITLATARGGRILLSPIRGAALASLDHGVTTGAFTLASAGPGLPQAAIAVSSYRLAGADFVATVAGRAALSARGVQRLAVETAGRLSAQGGDARFNAATCGPVSVQRLQLGGEAVTDLAAQLCPTPGLATVEFAAKGWAAHARYADLTGVSASLAARLSGAAGSFDLKSAPAQGVVRGPVQGVVQVAGATVTDISPTRRIEAIREAGVLRLASPQWTGRFDISSRSGRPLGVATVRLDPMSGRGEALLEMRDLAFAKGGLQPGEISPIVASLSPMAGKVSFTGRIAWADGKVTSEGDVATDDLALRSPLGAVTGIAAHIYLVSLAPLQTAPGQQVSAAQVASLVPLAPVSLRFALDPDGLDIQSASAGSEGGRITLAPTRLPFDAASTSRGALSLEAFNLGKLIATSSLADKVDLDAVVSGVLPYTLGPEGLRFDGGRLTAIKPGRIAIHRDALTTGPVTNAVQDMAFQALEALDFSQLDATVQSRPQGRLGLILHVVGSFEPKVEQEANLKIADVLSGKALKSYVPLPSHTPVNLNLDSSLNFDQLLSDYSHAFQFTADTQTPPKAPPKQQ